MFVLIECTTCRVGCDTSAVYEFEEGTTDKDLDAYAKDTAYDNAERCGIFDDEREVCEESDIEFDEGDCYGYSYRVLDGMTREEVEEQYGEIYNT